MFFSTTDSSGTITGYNGIFARVSGYDGGGADGRPRNVIRQPDIPKEFSRCDGSV